MASAPDGAPAGRRGRVVKFVLGVGISAVFLYATLAAVDLAAVFHLIGTARPGWIAACFGFIALAYGLKIFRWATMLRGLGASVRLTEAAVPFMGGVAFNNVLPFRAGDVIRVVAFQRFTGVPPSGQLGTLALERLLDLFVLMAILFWTVTWWQVDVLDPTLMTGLRLASAAVGAAIIVFIAAPHPIRLVVRWAEHRLPRLRAAGEALLRLSDAMTALSRPRFLAHVTTISFLAWLAEGAAYYAVGQALGVAPGIEAALLALSVGTLSTIIPSSPGYVGTFHYFTARVISAFGGTQAGAAAYAILIHALLWLATTASGFLLLALAAFGTKRPAIARTPGTPD